ncbi:LacI family DNA-binding transcriptional regulator [Fretibacter rubidus]|uniref:LacI family DNA-binding transcriptional regulator n=1 Tax=Fretibacter rubidus TaxID=570162 RepID=UPI00352A7734
MAKKMTMVDLANLAGVDISTVSRSLNDSPLVKQQTKDEIFRLASEHGYVINASARSLRKRSSETLGIVIPLDPKSGQTISDPFFLEMVGAVTQAAAKRGYDLIINIPDSTSQIAERRLLQTGRADGLIVIGQAGRVERLNALGDLVNKIVVWGGDNNDATYTVVGSDNFRGGRIAAEHLIERRRERILFVGDIALPEVKLRYDGMLEAHRATGLTHEPDLILSVPFGGKAAFTAIQSFLDIRQDFDAIFAASDVLAIGAIHALQKYGLDVPDDVAVVGYDNIGQSGMSTPSLTTIDQNISEGGELLVRLLLDKLDGKNVKSLLTETRLVQRNSS